MASRRPLEANLELFWDMVAKWLPDGLWSLILSCYGTRQQKGFQMVSGDSLELFWDKAAKWFPDDLWRLVEHSSIAEHSKAWHSTSSQILLHGGFAHVSSVHVVVVIAV